MLPFRKILFPIDYSEPCNAIVPAIRYMAAHFDSELLLLHSYYLPFAAYNEVSIAELISPIEVQQSEEKRLRAFADTMFESWNPRIIVEQQDPGGAIEHTVRREGVDLIMMPTSGRGPLRKLLLGSVTSKVLHDLSCPIWTGVHRSLLDHNISGPYDSILCAVSLGEEACAVIRAASLLAKSFGAKLAVVHAVDAQRAVLDIESAPYLKTLMDSAEERLHAILHETGVEAGITVMEGPIAACIHDEAERRRADLVITGRGHAHGALSRLWSHLSEIVRTAPCPVLSI
jgi:nucleotide-binding universal stress UspA family protein